MRLVLVLACCCLFSETVFSQSWQRIGNIDTTAYCIGTNPRNNDAVWVGSRKSVFISYDKGKSVGRIIELPSVSYIIQVLIHPVDTSLIFMGGAKCLVSRDNGTTWTETLPDTGIAFNSEGIAYEPGKPDTLYVGVFINKQNNNHPFFRSTDRGQSWVPFPVLQSPINAFCTVTAGGNGLLLGGFMFSGKIVRSTDAGETWTQVYTHPNPDFDVPKIVFDKKTPGTVWALLWNSASDEGTGFIVKSTDYGQTWTPIPFNGNPWSLEVDSNGKLYVGVAGAGNYGVYVSSDQGATWLNHSLGYPTEYPEPYLWTFKISNDGSTLFAADLQQGAFRLDISQPLTAVEPLQTPPQFALAQNYPNPFNPSTTIRFSLPDQRRVSLAVYNLLGQEMARLFNDELGAGAHEVSFDATGLPSGIYIYRLRAGDIVQTGRMVLSK